MKKFLTLLLLTASLNSYSQVNDGMPDLKEVINVFFNAYTPPDQQKILIRFQKRPEGWFTAEYEFANNTIPGKPALFWSKYEQQYKTLPYEETKPEDSVQIRENIESYLSNYSTSYDEYYFAHNFFYGYDGWDSDVIDFAEKQNNLSDTALESLARAYSNYAANYFYGQFGYTSVSKDTSLTPISDTAQIPLSRVEKFIAKEKKALEIYDKLVALNSNYETIIGSIKGKPANERMFAYTNLKFIGYGKEGEFLFNGLHFEDSLLTQAAQMLDSAKPNSIVFSIGDNVTYPMWYLQYKGKRQDLIVLNFDLLALRRSLSYLDNAYNHSLFNATPAVFLSKSFDYSLYQTEAADTNKLRLDTFIARLYKSPDVTFIVKDKKRIYYTDKERAFRYYTKNTYMPVNADKAFALYKTRKLYTKIYLPVSKDYLTMSEMIEMDILQKNLFKRHIYFTFEPDDKNYLKYAIKHGDLYELTPEMH